MRYNRSIRRIRLIECARENKELTVYDLASRFGYRSSTVKNILIEEGIRKSTRLHRKNSLTYDEHRLSLLKEALEDSWTLARLAESLGVSRERARQLLTRYRSTHYSE